MKRWIIWITFRLGYLQAWYAAGYREGTWIEKVCIWPPWAVSRGLFLLFYYLGPLNVRD